MSQVVAKKQRVAQIQTGAPYGFTGVGVWVEADVRAGLPSLQIVGMGAKSVIEARQRVRSAILNSDLTFPAKKVTINLSPAELPKDGTHFDLPIAISILQAGGQLTARQTQGIAFAGELSLGGALLPVRGAALIAESAKDNGATTVFVPCKNLEQAALIQGITVIAARTLKEVVQYLYGALPLPSPVSAQEAPSRPSVVSGEQYPILDTIRGQEAAKRALTVAIAGRHNILLFGPPGTGKTHLARAAAGLLPPLSREESVEVMKLKGITESDAPFTSTPPLRAPHHSVTRTALIGGGTHPRPGDISLAHRGVLLLDELPEYPRELLESLRQPLEDKRVSLSRLYGSVTYPADSLLIATMNPCPCGFYGDAQKECRCTPGQRTAYRKRLSGPLLDRIDIFIPVPRDEDEYFFDTKLMLKKQQTTAVDLIKSISSLQNDRFKCSSKYNANASHADIVEMFSISTGAHEIIKKAQRTVNLSGRGALRTLRVARTVADIDQSPSVEPRHAIEALHYRDRLMLEAEQEDSQEGPFKQRGP